MTAVGGRGSGPVVQGVALFLSTTGYRSETQVKHSVLSFAYYIQLQINNLYQATQKTENKTHKRRTKPAKQQLSLTKWRTGKITLSVSVSKAMQIVITIQCQKEIHSNHQINPTF